MILRRHSLAAFALLFGIGSVSFGQTGQYTAPGALGIAPENKRELLQAAVETARWRFGPLRVDPWISLRDITFVLNEDGESDISAGIGAGVRSYIPFGSKLVVAAHIMPVYIWHKERSEENRVAGRYGLGLFYNTDRLSVELSANSSDLNAFASSEVTRRAQIDNVSYRAHVEVPILRRLRLFASATRNDQLVNDPDPGAEDLSDLSLQTDWFEGGLRWQVGNSLQLSLGAGTTQSEFDERAPNRANEGEFLSAAIDWNRSKTGASVSFRKNDLRGSPGSSFNDFDSSTWRGQVRWSPKASFSAALYGQHDLSYSIYSDESTYLDERAGVRFSFPIGRRLSPSFFYEIGQNRYTDGERVDDVTTWGGSLALPPLKWFRVILGGRTTRITDGQGSTRSFTEWGGGLSLTIGSDRSGWY